ncbi:hypothetical protein MJO29_008777 [Puccinia striiformis f. sp. tritici]|nr:hypothetical protein MJO29_008777 [Puccinia striiformis f. sp. tritici]KAI9603211.1 hypothetical protein H4Q26_002529 [Puccinia striiformis f. sp. tritici PST-130]KNE89210.1 hypothetical protein PSTG_17331 [Puccinia striiformis f. sp. tritici PST-78]POW07433.1 hypothetical protein PSHT_09935 [Puccinia striiformis]
MDGAHVGKILKSEKSRVYRSKTNGPGKGQRKRIESVGGEDVLFNSEVFGGSEALGGPVQPRRLQYGPGNISGRGLAGDFGIVLSGSYNKLFISHVQQQEIRKMKYLGTLIVAILCRLPELGSGPEPGCERTPHRHHQMRI